MRRKKPKTITPVRPNLGIAAEYQRRLDKLIREMNNSVRYWMEASYRNNEPAIMALDATPATVLSRRMAALRKQWMRNWEEAAEDLARWFARSVQKRTDTALMAALRKGGFAIDFKPTPAQRDIMQATVQQNVSLIKSIPSQYLADVEGLVMRSVQSGGDLGTLTKGLQSRYGITQRRAALIARDQNSKATTAMERARQQEAGITQAVWRHSHAGKEPRPKHVAADGKVYDVRKGLKIGDKGQWVFPGEEINCRCFSQAVIPGF